MCQIPSRTPEARSLARARYNEKKSDPEAAEKQLERAREARAKYEASHRDLRAWKRRLVRAEKVSRDGQQKPKDYEFEWELYKEKKRRWMAERVADELQSAQRVAEDVPRGGAKCYKCYTHTLPAWHACCDAGEHDHPPNPSQPSSVLVSPPNLPPLVPQAPGLSILSRLVTLTPVRMDHSPPATPTASHHQAQPSAPMASTAAPPAYVTAPSDCYAVRGGGVVHSNLTSALAQFEAVVAVRSTQLLTTEDSRAAAHFAAGFTRIQAMAVSQSQNATDVWLGSNPPSWTGLSDAARRARHRHCITELCQVLRILKDRREESDSEGMWEDVRGMVDLDLDEDD
ncbi:hypothetical protein B0H16DRAFT_1457456 [Mycena metata]|uniref:Uncharacterized protein n=1 Tax=Mycena metata TaxID=1033252 RepID=A0AAD7NDU8_9AGAR|nr:hypothetical protein B0H16DRAFT_1457456 [Mycena metata]